MNIDPEWETNFNNEIQKAILARNSGNEGKARVCARRAVGIAIGEYLLRKQFPDPGTSFYERVFLFLSFPFIDESLKEISSHFLFRVTPDHDLPIEADLVQEAIYLKDKLFNS